MTAPKLVRDLVPDAIRDGGLTPRIRVADTVEFRELLLAKLVEEVGEFLDSGDPTELADIAEVLRALAVEAGIGTVGLERLRRAKLDERGGFEQRLVWLGNEDGGES